MPAVLLPLLAVYAISAVAGSAVVGYRACMNSPAEGVGFKSHALGLLTFGLCLIGALMLACAIATSFLLAVGAAM